MSDDLVKRLRERSRQYVDNEYNFDKRAADRIEKLEANIKLQLEWYLSNKRVLDDRIETLEAALRYIELHAGNPMIWYAKIARKALEGKDD